MVPVCKTDYFAEELLVYLAKDIGRQNRELIRAVGIIQVLDYLFKGFVVYVQFECGGISGFTAAFFFFKMEQA